MAALERITVEVPTETAEAMRRSVTDGLYGSPEEIIELALSDWFESQVSDERKLEWLRAAIKEGDESGPGIPAEQVFAEVKALIASYEKPSEAA